jgi:hypothetical protein
MPQSGRHLTAFLLTTFLVAIGGCGTSAPGVKPDDMSAADHRAEADREDAEARSHAAQYDPRAARPMGLPPVTSTGSSSSDYIYSTAVYNPTDVHLQHADQHRAHALQHEKAARALEHFEEAECRGFPPSSRAACPLLGPALRVDDIPGGVRVTFSPGTRVDAVAAHMRCQYAYARARAFAESVSCPLYMRGIEVKQARDPLAIDITTSDPARVEELRNRSREEAVFVRKEKVGP